MTPLTSKPAQPVIPRSATSPLEWVFRSVFFVRQRQNLDTAYIHWSDCAGLLRASSLHCACWADRDGAALFRNWFGQRRRPRSCIRTQARQRWELFLVQWIEAILRDSNTRLNSERISWRCCCNGIAHGQRTSGSRGRQL